MSKTNLTIQLETKTVLRAKVLAAKRGTSVSALVARTLEDLVAEEERYQAAYRRAVELMDSAGARGGQSWTRDELHDR
jgi:hypothetical protein